MPPPDAIEWVLAAADNDPYALSASERARVLEYSREQAELARAEVGVQWSAAIGPNGTVSDADAGPYEAAVRAHGEHLGRAVTMTALDTIEAAGADEAGLRAAGAFDGTDWDHRGQLVADARVTHERAWRDALATELPHRSFGNVAPDTEFGTGMTKARKAAFAQCAAVYPDGMITHSNEHGLRMHVRLSSKRAHFQPMEKFPVKVKAPQYVDAHNLVNIIKHKKPSTPANEAVAHGLSFGSSGHSAPDSDGAPTSNSSEFGVPGSPEQRAALEEAVTAWATDPDLCKRHGANPRIITAHDGALYVRSDKTKSLEVSSKFQAELTTNGSTDTTVHELAHRMEYSNRQIGAACRAFHRRRTAGLSPTLYAKTGKTVEMATEDSFVDHYTGKDYPNSPNNTEVFSTGMEAVAAGTFGGLTGHRRTITPSGIHRTWGGRVDTEHHALILGLLSTASADRD